MAGEGAVAPPIGVLIELGRYIIGAPAGRTINETARQRLADYAATVPAGERFTLRGTDAIRFGSFGGKIRGVGTMSIAAPTAPAPTSTLPPGVGIGSGEVYPPALGTPATGEAIFKAGVSIWEKLSEARYIISRLAGLGLVIVMDRLQKAIDDAAAAASSAPGDAAASKAQADRLDREARDAIRAINAENAKTAAAAKTEAARNVLEVDRAATEFESYLWRTRNQREIARLDKSIAAKAKAEAQRQAAVQAKADAAGKAMNDRVQMIGRGLAGLIGIGSSLGLGALSRPRGTSVNVGSSAAIPSPGLGLGFGQDVGFTPDLTQFAASDVGLLSGLATGAGFSTVSQVCSCRPRYAKRRKQKSGEKRICYTRKG